MTLQEAADLLGVTLKATGTELQARWYQLGLLHHPDHGGDATTFSRLTDAYRLLREPRGCPRCEGRGSIVKSRGFNSLTLLCPTCLGAKIITP